MTFPQNSDLLVIGGGVIGLSIARACQLRGQRVALLDRPQAGMAASVAAAGMLSPLAEASEDGPFLDTGLASLAQYPAWVDAVEAEGRGQVGFRASGKWKVAQTDEGFRRLEALAARMADRALPFRWAPANRLQLAGVPVHHAHDALFLERDAHLDPRWLVEILARAANRAGVVRHVDSAWEVSRIAPNTARGITVHLTDGRTLAAAQVVLAGGAWTGTIDGLPAGIPQVRPVLGQALMLDAPEVPLQTTLETEGIYLVPRSGGRILVGATVEERGFQILHTAEARDHLWGQASAVVPSLADAVLAAHWSGLRPGTPDTLPVIGPVPGIPGLVLATGHFRNGILLAPWTGEAVARCLTGGEGPNIPEAFLPTRASP
jgi:glycine oxidase